MTVKAVMDTTSGVLVAIGRDAEDGETLQNVSLAQVEASAEVGNAYADPWPWAANSKIKAGTRPLLPGQAALWAYHQRLDELMSLLRRVESRHDPENVAVAAKMIWSLHRGMYVRCQRSDLTLPILATMLTESAKGPLPVNGFSYDPADPQTIAPMIDSLSDKTVQPCILIVVPATNARRNLLGVISNDIRVTGESIPTEANLNRGHWIDDITI